MISWRRIYLLLEDLGDKYAVYLAVPKGENLPLNKEVIVLAVKIQNLTQEEISPDYFISEYS